MLNHVTWFNFTFFHSFAQPIICVYFFRKRESRELSNLYEYWTSRGLTEKELSVEKGFKRKSGTESVKDQEERVHLSLMDGSERRNKSKT